MLANPAYAGRLRVNGEERPGQHPPIISQATWSEAGRLREARLKTQGNGRGRRPKLHLLIGGLLRCPDCEGPMMARSNPRRSGPDTYVCWEHEQNPPPAP
jgi:hypothetical protein